MNPITRINADVVNALTNGAVTAKSTDVNATKMLTKDLATDKRSKTSSFWITYFASLIGAGVTMPIIASAFTVGLYFSFPQTPPWFSVTLGLILTICLWLLVAAFCYSFASLERASMSTYGRLKSHLSLLRAHLGIRDDLDVPVEMTIEEMRQATGMDNNGGSNVIALREAYTHYAEISRTFKESCTGLQWVLGTGYLNLWRLVHRAEEALIEVEPLEMVIRGAIHDKLSIQNSVMSSRDELLAKLIQAVTELDPATMDYFKEHQPTKLNEEILKMRQILTHYSKVLREGKISASVINDLDGIFDNNYTNLAPDLQTQARARAVLREVRRTLNSFRDNLWEKLVRARNQLLVTIALTSLVTHFLFCITILTDAIYPATVTGVVAFYMVGGVAGVFGRFYRESRTSSTTEDYGLSLTRLIATPLLSGLAGVGGVLITGLLYSSILSGNIPNSLSVPAIFQYIDPRYLLVAGIFGLTPNLLIRSLQKESEKYVSGLQSVKGAEQEEVNSGH